MHGMAVGAACILIVIALAVIMSRPATKPAEVRPAVVAGAPTPVTVEPEFIYPDEPVKTEPVEVTAVPAPVPVVEDEPEIPPPTPAVDPRAAG